MTSETGKMDGWRAFNWRVIGWGGAAALLALPFVAMRAGADGVDWSGSDFVVFGTMLLLAGLGLEFLVRRAGNAAYRIGAGLAVLAAFLLVWVNLAVGFLCSENNIANLMFLAVLAVLIVGGMIVRFRPDGMAHVLLATAATQALVGVIGLVGGFASPGSEGVYEVVMGTTLFGGLWLLSAWAFSRAAVRG